MTSPNIEERLTAAAFAILTDDNRHSHQAMRWAASFIRRAAHGRRTEFQASLQHQRYARKGA